MNIRISTGIHDNTKLDELTEQEQTEWLKNHKAEEWNGKMICEGDIIDLHNGRIVQNT